MIWLTDLIDWFWWMMNWYVVLMLIELNDLTDEKSIRKMKEKAKERKNLEEPERKENWQQ